MNNGTVNGSTQKKDMDLSQMTQTVRMCSFTILPSFPKATRALTKDRRLLSIWNLTRETAEN